MDFRIEYGTVNVLMRYTGTDAEVIVPDDVDTIKCRAFLSREGLRSVTISDSVKAIGDDAFAFCDDLECVIFGTGVTNVGNIFDYCDNVKTILVKEGNPIYHSAGNCLIDTQQKKLVLGCQSSVIPTDGSVTSIGAHAFDGCKNLKSIDIPPCVTRIEKAAFYDCAGLEKVSFGEGVREIGEGAFESCGELRELVFHQGLQTIEKMAFYDCYGLQKVTLPDSLTAIGDHVFTYCEKLFEIVYTGKIPILHAFELEDALTHFILLHPDFFHMEDIRYAWYYTVDFYLEDCDVFTEERCANEPFIAELSIEECLSMERLGLITKENGGQVLELLRKCGNVECVVEMIRYLNENRILDDYEETFRLDLEDEDVLEEEI